MAPVGALHPEPVLEQHGEPVTEDVEAPRMQLGLLVQGADQAIETVHEAGISEVVKTGLLLGRPDKGRGTEHQRKSEPPSTLTLAPVT